MRCKNCDSDIPAGKLECPFCGAEVILVPEYMSADMEREQERLRVLEEERYLKERELRREQRLQGRRMSPAGKAVRTVCVILIAALLSYALRFLIIRNSMRDYGYLKTEADRAYERSDPDAALSYLTEAEKVRQDVPDVLSEKN